MLLKLLSLRHTVSPSALTYLAYHHSGATPLMLSIITGKFDCASLLLAAGARVDLKNRRGKTAADIARETRAPISLTRAPADETDSVEFDQCDPVVSCAFWSCRLLFATCWNASNQITHHYNRSDHNLYNIYIYTHYIYIYISICEPTVSCFTRWIRQSHSAIRPSFYVLCVTKWTGWVNQQWLSRYPWASAIGFDSNQYSARWNNIFALMSRSL